MLYAAPLWATLKLLGWALVIFGPLAQRLFGGGGKPTERTLIAPAIKMVFAAVVIVHGLSLIGAFDMFGVAICLAALALGRMRMSQRPIAKRATSMLDQGRAAIYTWLDGEVSPLAWLRSLAGSQMARARVGMRADRMLPALSLLLVTALTLALRAPGTAAYPYPVGDREAHHIDRLKDLGGDGLSLFGAYYPKGAHALALFANRVARIDEALLWKVVGPVSFALMVWVVAVVVRRLARGRATGASVFSAGLAGVVGTSSLANPTWPGIEVHPWHVAAVVLPLVIASACLDSPDARATPSRGPPRQRAAGIAIGMAALALIHPLAWLVAFVMLAFLALGRTALLRQSPGRAFASVGPALVGLLPATWLVIPSLAGGEVERGVGTIATELLSTGAISSAHEWPLLAAGMVAALTVIVWRRPQSDGAHHGEAMWGSAYLGIWSLVAAPKLGVALPLPSEGLEIIIPALSCISIGVAVSRVAEEAAKRVPINATWRRYSPLASLALLAALSGLANPRAASAESQPESLPVLLALEDLRDRFVAGTWTIVANRRLGTHVAGHGWHITRGEFLSRYQPQTYRWDPREPHLSIPSTHSFLIVERTFTDEVALSAEEREARLTSSAALERWCEDYMASHGDMQLITSTDALRIYHLHRTKEVERRVLAEVYRQSQRSGHSTPALND